MKRLFLILLLISSLLKAENNPREVKTDIKNVTVFLSGAQVTRSANVTIDLGNTTLKFSNLSPDIDERSIRVRGEGKFTVMSVSFQVNYLREQEKTRAIEELIAKKEVLADKISIESDVLAVYQQEESMLMENKKLGGTEIGVQVLELKDAVNFYRNRLLEIKTKQTEVKKNIKKLNDEITKINTQLADLNGKQSKPTGEVLVNISSKMTSTGTVVLVYKISQAGWLPSYDIRVKDVTKPLSLIYKANVFQQSGEDWENVKLRLSTANPNQGGEVPVLSPKLLATYSYNRPVAGISTVYGSYNPSIRQVSGYVRSSDGGGLPGVNVVVKGTTVGTTTNSEGFYTISIPANSNTLTYSFIGYVTEEVPVSASTLNIILREDIASLQEVVVVGYGMSKPAEYEETSTPKLDKKIIPLATSQIQNTTSVEFEIQQPYSISTDGKRLAVEMQEYELPALYQYHAIPKLDKDAFLTAKVVGWEDLQLLSGETNLFFEDTYVGKSLIDVAAINDTLHLSLGRDKNITVERKEVKTFVSKQFIGANQKESKGFEIVVRNKKAQPVNIIIEDQVPVSTVKEISVDPIEISKAELEKDSGKLTWNFELKPSTSKKLELKYEVKYPKYLHLNLD